MSTKRERRRRKKGKGICSLATPGDLDLRKVKAKSALQIPKVVAPTPDSRKEDSSAGYARKSVNQGPARLHLLDDREKCGASRMERENQQVLELLSPERLENYPCAIFLDLFTLEELEASVREYLKIHNFRWFQRTYPVPKGLAKNLDFCQRDFPADMSDAMSLESFGHWLENQPLNEESARKFCQTVCSIAKGMYYLYHYSQRNFAKIEDTFESALELQYALYPNDSQLKKR